MQAWGKCEVSSTTTLLCPSSIVANLYNIIPCPEKWKNDQNGGLNPEKRANICQESKSVWNKKLVELHIGVNEETWLERVLICLSTYTLFKYFSHSHSPHTLLIKALSGGPSFSSHPTCIIFSCVSCFPSPCLPLFVLSRMIMIYIIDHLSKLDSWRLGKYFLAFIYLVLVSLCPM